jgi:hypothetical protein
MTLIGQTKRICVRGHDTEVVGRDRSNRCRECERIRHRGQYLQGEPRPEVEDRLNLQYHLLDKHGMTLQDDLGMGRLQAALEWAHRFVRTQG